METEMVEEAKKATKGKVKKATAKRVDLPAGKLKKAVHKSDAMQFLEELTDGPLTFGRMLKSIRECEEESLSIFGGRIGISKQYVNQIESGKRHVSVQQAARFADALGYSRLSFVKLCFQDMLNVAGVEGIASVEAA